jgi:hypothetical protein
MLDFWDTVYAIVVYTDTGGSDVFEVCMDREKLDELMVTLTFSDGVSNVRVRGNGN